MAEAEPRGRDVTVAVSAAGAIFAGLVGTNLLRTDTRTHILAVADYIAIFLWLPALLFLGYYAYKGPDAREWAKVTAGVLTGVAGGFTAVVLLFTGFGLPATRTTSGCD